MEWSEAKPVLETTYRLLAQSDEVSGQAVNQALGRASDDEAAGRVLEKLHEGGYIKGHFVMQTSLPIMIESTEKGLQETSGWPAPGGAAGAEQVELLLRLLDERIDDETTPEEERGRLRRARTAVGDVGRGVLTEVLAAYIARVSGADR